MCVRRVKELRNLAQFLPGYIRRRWGSCTIKFAQVCRDIVLERSRQKDPSHAAQAKRVTHENFKLLEVVSEFVWADARLQTTAPRRRPHTFVWTTTIVHAGSACFLWGLRLRTDPFKVSSCQTTAKKTLLYRTVRVGRSD